MILQALYEYYHRLAKNPHPTQGARVPTFGFSEEKISYILTLSASGELVDLVPYLTDDKKPQPRLMSVPRPEKRTSGVKPNFLWDKTTYVLGVSAPKDKKSPAKVEESMATFVAFRTLHLQLLNNSQDKGLIALRSFLSKWEPHKFSESILKPEMLDTNIVFRLDGMQQFIHDSDEARSIWAGLLIPSEESSKATCLITGVESPIARLHPAIKGVSGGQSSGVSIVSFNKESFASFGKEQGNNAQVSEEAAFAYTTALNYLLRRENKHVITLGEISVVFWATAEKQLQAERSEDLFGHVFSIGSVTDGSETTKLTASLEAIARGKALKEIDPELKPETKFYILGLTPNAARLSIRFWLETTFGDIHKHYLEHYNDLLIKPQPWRTAPSMKGLLLQLTPSRENKKQEFSEIPPQLAGEMWRSILTGSRYPQTLLANLLARFRSDGHISGLRVAMVKAVLQRDFRKNLIMEDVPMALDENNNNVAYNLGRLFALLENIQKIALGNQVNATIADKYFATASTVPFSVYPRLISGSKYHLSKIRKDKPGLAVNLEKEITEIILRIPVEFPRHLSIENQGRFAIGYYHQREMHYENLKSNTNNSTSEGEEK